MGGPQRQGMDLASNHFTSLIICCFRFEILNNSIAYLKHQIGKVLHMSYLLLALNTKEYDALELVLNYANNVFKSSTNFHRESFRDL